MKDKLIENGKNQEKFLSLYELLEYQNNNKLLPKIQWQDKPLTTDINCVIDFFLEDFEKEIKNKQWKDSRTLFCFCKKEGVESLFKPSSIIKKVSLFAKNTIEHIKEDIVLTFQILCIDIIYKLAKESIGDKELFKKYNDMIEQCANKYERVFISILNFCTEYATTSKDGKFLSSIDLIKVQVDKSNQTENSLYNILQKITEPKKDIEDIFKSSFIDKSISKDSQDIESLGKCNAGNDYN